MLDGDYQERFGELIKALPWSIELPREWADYFEERGELPTFRGDPRTNQRLKVRVHGALWFEDGPRFLRRPPEPVGIYTRDFSRQGAGMLCPIQLYPEEKVRIILPTFWVRMNVMRARRLTRACYEIGTQLLEQHEPDLEVFEMGAT